MFSLVDPIFKGDKEISQSFPEPGQERKKKIVGGTKVR